MLAAILVFGVVSCICLAALRSDARQALAVAFVGYTNLPSGERVASFTISNQCYTTVKRWAAVYVERYPFAPTSSPGN
jgi:hypothetical protein